jgi:hypothetical protein
MPTYHGSCHCGAVTFRIEGEITASYTCDCSLCRKKNALMAKIPQDWLTITSGEDKLSLYQWNTRVAKHYFCSACGIYPFHRKRSDPTEYGVNLHCLDDFDPLSLPTKLGKGKGMTLVADGARDVWPGPRDL